jgi:flagellar hook-associated protein 2
MSSPINVFNSGLDVGSIVDSLIHVESAPIRRMKSQVTVLQSRINAYQNLNSTMSSLSNSINRVLFGTTDAPFVIPHSFDERLSRSVFLKHTVKSSDDKVVSASASNATTGGSYSLTVNSLARAKSEASSGFSDPSSNLAGTGSLTITTGDRNPVVIEIDESNNTLYGIRNAINRADAGVTATIINDGSEHPYRLLITSKNTGTANVFTIEETLSGGQALGFEQTQAAADANFIVNGITISKSSNVVSDVIGGVTLNLKDVSATPVTIHIESDTDSIVNTVNEFIAAYNAVNTFINHQFTYNASSEKAGVLSGDITLRRIQNDLQTLLTRSVANDLTSFSVAGQVGIEFNRDGSLTLNEGKFREVLGQDMHSVAALLLGEGNPTNSGTATDNRVQYTGQTAATQAGTYAIQVDTLAQQASAIGSLVVDLLAENETLTITHGETTASVELLQHDTLETVLEKVNAAFAGQGMDASAVDDGGRIRISTNTYGSAQSLTIVSDRNDDPGSTGFGTTLTVATGTDIAGRINGNAAIGIGRTLTGAEGQPEEGLRLTVDQTETGPHGTVTVTIADPSAKKSGIFMNIQGMLKGITDPLSGPIHQARDSLNQNIRSINDQIRNYEERLEIRKEILLMQFIKADEALKLLEVNQASLTNQINSLKKL